MGNTRLPLRHETIVHNPKALRVSPSSAPFCPAAELISSAAPSHLSLATVLRYCQLPNPPRFPLHSPRTAAAHLNKTPPLH
jgi:hypothetical protein